MAKLSIRDLDLTNQRVLMRVDFNIPLSEDGQHVTDDTRIRETLPTIEYALSKGAKLILMSHLGRPKGKPNDKMSLRPAAERLRILLDRQLSLSCNVGFCPECVGPIAEEMTGMHESGQTLVLENLRFHSEEEKNDPKFAEQLARLCDIYVNDAFGSAHRAHASTEGITHYVRQSAAGLLMEKELKYLGAALENPNKPFVAIIGGAKVSDKIAVIDNLLSRVDALLIGGAMAYTFLKSQGHEVGKSLVESDKLDVAAQALAKAQQKNVKLLLPVDHVIAKAMSGDAQAHVVESNEAIPADEMGLDIGPKTIDLFSKEIADAQTIVWNGPMGVFEMAQFSHGTTGIALAVAEATENGATSIIGGGDSVAAVKQAGIADKISHISTGGGASLEFLEGRTLPGVEALTDK